jgi:F-type H+-transporting ATPase subunit b
VLPDLSVLWVILFVLLSVAVLNSLVFKPLLKVMHEREGAIESARELARKAAADARRATEDFEARTTAARAEVYREMEAARKEALAQRAVLLAETRQEAEASLTTARQTLATDVAAARDQLTRDAEALSGAVVERVLDRRAP